MSKLTPYAERAYGVLRIGNCLIPYKAPGGMTVYKQGYKDRSGYYSPLPKSETFMKSVIDDLVGRNLAEPNTLGYLVLKK